MDKGGLGAAAPRRIRTQGSPVRSMGELSCVSMTEGAGSRNRLEVCIPAKPHNPFLHSCYGAGTTARVAPTRRGAARPPREGWPYRSYRRERRPRRSAECTKTTTVFRRIRTLPPFMVGPGTTARVAPTRRKIVSQQKPPLFHVKQWRFFHSLQLATGVLGYPA